MARPETDRVRQLRAELTRRAVGGHLRPGDRFLSTRRICQLYGVSYQTAHRLLAALVEGGVLFRKVGSGTFVAGRSTRPRLVGLWFHGRAGRGSSFGGQLLGRVRAALERDGLEWLDLTGGTAEYAGGGQAAAGVLPVVWECGMDWAGLAAGRHYGLLLNQAPPPGMAGLFVDSVAVDDVSGGVCAGEILAAGGAVRRVAVLAAPLDDERSRQRVDGFRRVFPDVRVVPADGWYLEHGRRAIDRLERAGPLDGVFATNDRLAEAVLESLRQGGGPRPRRRGGRVRVVGFDDAPVAVGLGLSTVAIPWDELAAEAARLARRRIRGDTGAPLRVQLAPRPVVRES